MYSQRRKVLSQNFLHSRKLINQLVRQSSLCSRDTVIEIGTGKGIITAELIRTAKNVIGIEIDTILYEQLKKSFLGAPLQLINKDFLQWRLPTYTYKVFANIPFSIEGKIIRKLLDAPSPPEDCYLVMRRELAERLSGKYKESQFSLFYKPWFMFSMVHYFKRTDFEPAARMDTVLLRFTKRQKLLLPIEERKKYIIFVGQGFGGGKNLKYNLRCFFSHEQFKRASQACGIYSKANPSELRLEQWIKLYLYAKTLSKI